MPHGRLSQLRPDGVETVLVKPGRCVAELTDTSVVLGMSLGTEPGWRQDSMPKGGFQDGHAGGHQSLADCADGGFEFGLCVLFL